MDLPAAVENKPASLMRRMKTHSSPGVQKVSANGSEPMTRCDVEMTRGKVAVSLYGLPLGEVSIQWMQNGVPIRDQTAPTLHLANLTVDDTDIYYARLRTSEGETRSQPFLLTVWPGVPVVNFSTRGRVGAGRPLIVGFVVGRIIGPAQTKKYLIRAIGESLRKFGVTEPLRRPVVTLHRRGASFQELLKTDAPLLQEWQEKVGAFALEPGANEFVALAELPAGPYSITVAGEGDDAGEVLVELYETSA